MHIMEGFLPVKHAIGWTLASAPFVAYGIYSIKKRIAANPEQRILLGVAAAFSFVLSALKLPSVTGSCSHPTGTGLGAVMFGPAATWHRLGAASSPEGGEIDDITDIFDIQVWVDGQDVEIGALTVTPRLVCHPTESYGMRFTDPETGEADPATAKRVVEAMYRDGVLISRIGRNDEVETR